MSLATDGVCVAESWRLPPAPPLGERAVHVWRVLLDADGEDQLWPLLSPEEQERARRFHQDVHRRHFVVAHGVLRRVLASYAVGSLAAETITYREGTHGKPFLGPENGAEALEFNLSHSGNLALIAVARGRAVGVDVEQWDDRVAHLEIAERFFSRAECRELRKLAPSQTAVSAGFFAAWSRKEAYLKATGHGITRGLRHFDVSLTPDAPARLLVDRLDDLAAQRWLMASLSPAPGYSAALVAAAPIDEVLLFDALSLRHP